MLIASGCGWKQKAGIAVIASHAEHKTVLMRSLISAKLQYHAREEAENQLDGQLAEPGEGNQMPKFVIEREIPGAGKLSAQELQAISQKSCGVLREIGPQIQWVQSYVTDDRIYCIYIAPDEETVRLHAQMGEFPANRIAQVRSIIDPTTAD